MTTSNTVTKNDLAAILDDVLPVQGEDLTQAGVDSFVNGLNVNGSGFHSAKIGEVVCYAGTEAPYGWLKCDGSAVSRTTYSLLYSVIGTTYGSGDGSTTFNLPDLRDRFPVGAGSTYAVGSTGGEASVTLTEAEMPTHAGHLYSNVGVPYSGNATSKYLLYTALSDYGSVGRGWNNNSNEAYPAGVNRGSSSAHNNMPPYVGLIYIIYAGGDLAPVSVTPTMTDWVVEEGSKTNWKWRKWKSNKVEAWYYNSALTISAINTQTSIMPHTPTSFINIQVSGVGNGFIGQVYHCWVPSDHIPVVSANTNGSYSVFIYLVYTVAE